MRLRECMAPLGGAAVWPVAARAQHIRFKVDVILTYATPSSLAAKKRRR
jgi:hypothetical protein